jgi:hypothetical protein
VTTGRDQRRRRDEAGPRRIADERVVRAARVRRCVADDQQFGAVDE